MDFYDERADKPAITAALTATRDAVARAWDKLPPNRRSDVEALRACILDALLQIETTPSYTIAESTSGSIRSAAKAIQDELDAFVSESDTNRLDGALARLDMLLDALHLVPRVSSDEASLRESIRNLRMAARNAATQSGNRLGILTKDIAAARESITTAQTANDATVDHLRIKSEEQVQQFGARIESLDEQARTTLTRIEQSASELDQTRQAEAKALVQATRDEIEAQVSSLRTELQQMSQTIAGHEQQFRDTVASYEQALSQSLSSIDGRFADAQVDFEKRFGEGEQKRERAATQQLNNIQTRGTDARNAIRSEGDALIQQIEAIRMQANEVLGLSAAATTVEAYRADATEQKQAADRWRQVATAGLAVALGWVIFLALGSIWIDALKPTMTTDGWELLREYSPRLSILVVAGALAAYAADQSGDHRRREERSRLIANQLTTFRPFLAEVDPAQRERLTIDLAGRLFDGVPEGAARRDPHKIGFDLPWRKTGTDASLKDAPP